MGCPSAICGVWDQDKRRCESLCPLLAGLGMPSALQRIACPIADATTSTLRISCPDNGSIEIVDKTSFGRNATLVALDGTEAEKKTRGRGKVYMLSGLSLIHI